MRGEGYDVVAVWPYLLQILSYEFSLSLSRERGCGSEERDLQARSLCDLRDPQNGDGAPPAAALRTTRAPQER